MTEIDHEGLRAWYRNAMRGRIAEMEAIRGRMASQEPQVRREVHALGKALHESGGSFGFPEISEVGALLEDCTGACLPRYVDGALALLRQVAWPEDPERQERWTWLAETAGAALPGDLPDLAAAWKAAADAGDMAAAELAQEVADRYGLGVANLEELEGPAVRLVPAATCAEWGIVPLGEDDIHLRVATADPTDILTEAALRRLTGRIPLLEVAPPDRIGATVHLEAEAPPPRRRARPPGTPTGPATILLVDDERGSRLVARTVLSRKGFGVVEAGSGEEALEILRARPDVRLAVVDLNMPGMGGAGLVKALRAEEDTAALPVVVLTGSDDPVTEAALIEQGADDYIRKPIDPRLFLARVTATLRRAGA